MSDHRLLVPLLAGLATFLAIGLMFLYIQVQRAEMVARRLRSIKAGRARGGPSSRRIIGLLNGIAALGQALTRARLVPKKTLHEAQMLLAGANLRGEMAVAAFVGGKVLLLVGLPIIGWLLAGLLKQTGYVQMIAAAAGAVLALVAPDMVLGRRRRHRLTAIDRGLPDALDLLVICVDAGLAFEPALDRVTRELAAVHTEIAEEFAVTANELRIASDRRSVLLDMGARLDVEFLRRLASTLIQSMQIGAPLSQALRLLAQELRQEQMIRFEARAARLPVMLTLPMVAFIMPTVLLIVVGPAVVQLLRMP